MKKISILILAIVVFFLQSCQKKESQIGPTTSKEVNVESNKIVFENLDKILSPFEDMTEFALDKNEGGIIKSLNKVKTATEKSIFEKNLSGESIKLLNTKIKRLEKIIKQKKYKEIALASTEIFEYNVNNFIDAKKIENQINIEHLDYIGFKILALLNQDKIDWNNLEQTISNVQKKWLALSPKVNDKNLKDSFSYLFKGLYLSTQNKNSKMCKILAYMDLSLVDVLENSI